jgi:hypothetical protein
MGNGELFPTDINLKGLILHFLSLFFILIPDYVPIR